jgi:hypothetical protein
MSTTSLALPENAWRRRSTGGFSSLPRKFIAVLLLLIGIALVAGSLAARGRMSVVAPWFQIPEGLIWIVLADRVWRIDQTKVRRTLAVLLMLKGASPVGYMILGTHPYFSWIRLTEAAAWIGLGLGIWNAREWGRWGSGVWGLLLYGYYLASLTMGFRLIADSSPRDTKMPMIAMIIGAVFVASPPVALAIYSVLPSTRKDFTDAREATSRARAMPA